MKISYLSTVRLPTNKAYGVTVTETAHAAKRMGLKFTVFAPGPKSSKNENLIWVKSIKYSTIPIPYLKNLLNLLRFQFNSILIPIFASCKSEIRESDLIWLRDPISALVIATRMPDTRILLEIHHKPRILNLLVVKILSNKKNVKFGVISKNLQEEMSRFLGVSRTVNMPMAVPSSFYKTNQARLSSNPVTLVYLGKGQSSGHDNGLITLFNDFCVASARLKNLKLTFVGLEPSFEISLRKKALESSITEDKLEFHKHVKHSEVPDLLANFSIGLLPYPNSKYNNERFPLKSLEYAALELPILASAINSHLELIGTDKCWLYKPGDSDSFSAAVSSIMTSPSLASSKISNAKSWAYEYTYEKRVISALSAFPNFQSGNR